MNWTSLCRRAEAEVARIRATLPPDLAPLAADVPIVCLRRPTREMRADGIEPDLLGLFVGPSLQERGEEMDGGGAGDPLPAEILLFVENLWDYAEADPATFLEEVRITYLHELGHYLGLDESDLADRGLE
ncbi:MAG: metallopeptidase family protein [Kiritimatiellae bacterium]|nr:metallopeptidase family protein [Kiritimatiellia bacterium]